MVDRTNKAEIRLEELVRKRGVVAGTDRQKNRQENLIKGSGQTGLFDVTHIHRNIPTE